MTILLLRFLIVKITIFCYDSGLAITAQLWCFFPRKGNLSHSFLPRSLANVSLPSDRPYDGLVQIDFFPL
jgi:hypothetical protein